MYANRHRYWHHRHQIFFDWIKLTNLFSKSHDKVWIGSIETTDTRKNTSWCSYITCFRLPDWDSDQIVLSISVDIICSSCSLTKSSKTVTPLSPVGKLFTLCFEWSAHPTPFIEPTKVLPHEMHKWKRCKCLLVVVSFPVSQNRQERMPLQPHCFNIPAAIPDTVAMMPSSTTTFDLIGVPNRTNEKRCYTWCASWRMTVAHVCCLSVFGSSWRQAFRVRAIFTGPA